MLAAAAKAFPELFRRRGRTRSARRRPPAPHAPNSATGSDPVHTLDTRFCAVLFSSATLRERAILGVTTLQRGGVVVAVIATPEGAPDKRREYRISEKFGEWEVCEVETGTTIVCQGTARADAISMARGLADQYLQEFHNQSDQRS